MENNQTATILQLGKVLYTARVTTTGGRDGASHSSDGELDVRLKPFGSPVPGTNPEQLFAAGWSACFIASIKIAASKMKIALPESLSIDAEVDLCMIADEYYLQARLNVSLPGLPIPQARDLVHIAHQTCPYSKATRGNIEVVINLSLSAES